MYKSKKKEEVVAKCDHLAKLLAPAESDVQSARTRLARTFMKEFKRAKNIRVEITVKRTRVDAAKRRYYSK